MFTNINHLKKNESILNKQLLLIDSNNKEIIENSSNFTNSFNKAKRISIMSFEHAEMQNSVYNVNDDSVVLEITKTLVDDTVIKDKLNIDDTELENNKIFSTNELQSSVKEYNYQSSNDVQITDLQTTQTFLYTTSLFTNELVQLFNTDGINSVSTISELTEPSNIVCCCYSIDQTFLWRFKITGNIKYSKISTSVDGVYILGKIIDDVSFYNSDDTLASTLTLGNSGGLFVCKYDLDGNFVWRVKCLQNDTDNETKICIQSDETSVYILSTFKDGDTDLFYDSSDTLVQSSPTLPASSTSSFLIRYNSDGTYTLNNTEFMYDDENLTGTSIITPTSLTLTEEDVFVSVDFNIRINLTDVLTSDGIINVGLIKYIHTTTLDYVGRLKIGGSSSNSNCHLATNNEFMYIIGDFNANPIVFYKSDDSIDTNISNTQNTQNSYIIKYPLDFLDTPASIIHSYNITSESEITSTDIKVNDNGIVISCNFVDNLKFNDTNGYVESKDIVNIASENKSQSIALYSLDGIFSNRSYNANSGTHNIIDINSSDIISYNNFILANTYYDINDNIDGTISPKGTQNGVIVSYNSTNTNITINYDTLDYTILCTSFVRDEVSLVLNANTFSEQLGFDASQKFIASSFGGVITWDELIINSSNNTIVIEYTIINKTTQLYETNILNFTIDEGQFTTYTPYSLVFKLNQIFSIVAKNTSFLTQTINTFYYDNNKKIFYIRCDIEGTFNVQSTQLSTDMNLSILESPQCVISNNIVSETNEIKDTTKLTLKLTDNTITNIFNSVSSNSVFPNVNSNKLTMFVATEGSTTNISAITELVSDDVLNIKDGDRISFDINFNNSLIPSTIITDWSSIGYSKLDVISTIVDNYISMSSTGQYQTMVIGNDVYRTEDGDAGTTWESIKITPDEITWKAIAVSSTGQYQCAVGTNSHIFESVDYGVTWSPYGFVADWSAIAISSDGQIQSACINNGNIMKSIDGGVTWIKSNIFQKAWVAIDMSDDGKIQSAIGSGDIWHTINGDATIPTWTKETGGGSLFVDISVSADGTTQVAAHDTNLWVTTDGDSANPTWSARVSSPPNILNVRITSDGVLAYGQDYAFDLHEFNISTDGTSVIYTASSGSFNQCRINMLDISDDADVKGIVLNYAYAKNERMTEMSSIGGGAFGETIIIYSGDTIDVSITSDGSTQTITKKGSILLTNDINANIWSSFADTVDEFHEFIFGKISSDGLITITGDSQGGGEPRGEIKIYNTGGTFTFAPGGNFVYYSLAAMSSDGDIIIVYGNDGTLWYFVDGKVTPSISSSQSGLSFNSLDMSGDANVFIGTQTNGDISKSIGDINSWVPQSVGPKDWSGVAISNDGLIACACVNGGDIYVTVNGDVSVSTWDAQGVVNNWTDIAISSDGSIICACESGGTVWLYNSGDIVPQWAELVIPSSSWNGIDISSQGNMITVVSNETSYVITPFVESVELNVVSVSKNSLIFSETPTNSNMYELLNNYNMMDGINYVINKVVSSKPQDIFIKPGNYTNAGLITQINTQITDVNPLITNMFSYNPTTSIVTFNPFYVGSDEEILVSTKLLQTMGFTILPKNIVNSVLGTAVIDIHTCTSVLYIQIANNNITFKEDNLFPNMKKVSAIMKLDTVANIYKIERPFEVFLSKKTNIDDIQIKLVNADGNLINLNGGRILIHVYLIKS